MTDPRMEEIRLRIVEAIAKHCTSELIHDVESVAKIASRLESYVIGSTQSVQDPVVETPKAGSKKSKKADNSTDPFS